MERNLTPRFWFETAASSACAVLFVVTLVWPRWMEILFQADPDHGSGQLEWLILLVTLTTSVLASVLARREWRRMHGHTVTGSGPA